MTESPSCRAGTADDLGVPPERLQPLPSPAVHAPDANQPSAPGSGFGALRRHSAPQTQHVSARGRLSASTRLNQDFRFRFVLLPIVHQAASI